MNITQLLLSSIQDTRYSAITTVINISREAHTTGFLNDDPNDMIYDYTPCKDFFMWPRAAWKQEGTITHPAGSLASFKARTFLADF